jgi:hypothetical protein
MPRRRTWIIRRPGTADHSVHSLSESLLQRRSWPPQSSPPISQLYSTGSPAKAARQKRAIERDLAQLPLQIAVVGLAPSLAFAFAWIGGWRRVAVATFTLAVGTYLTWAVVADAAVHGWDDLKLFPF